MPYRPLRAFPAALALVALAGCASQPQGYERDKEEHEQTGGPEAAGQRWQSRLSADGTIPPNALIRAKQQRDAMRPAQSLADTTFDWKGPGNIGGRLRAIIVHPTDPNTIWVGAATGGVWKSTNGGSSFQPLDDFVPALTIGCMAIDPSNPNTLYAGTGEGFFNTEAGTSNTAAPIGAGIFKTTDGGQTWTQLPQTATPDWYYVNRIALQPGNPSTLLAATNSGIWRSTDAGQTWTQVNTAHNTLQVLFHPTDPLRALAGDEHGAARYSLDGGLTWTAAPALPAGSARVELAYAPSDPNTVFAAVSTGSALRIFRSTNGGQSYTLMTSGSGISTLGNYTGVLWVDPLNANTLLLGGQGMYRSTNAGATFNQTFSGVHADHHVITPHPAYNGTTNKTLFFGNDGGIYRTTDSAGSTAASLNNNMGVTQFYGAAINDSSGVIVGGTQDNGTLRSPGTGTSYTSMYGGDGTYAASDPTNPNFFYGAWQRLGIVRSSNGGLNANQVTSGLTDQGTLNTNFIAYFFLDPNEPNRMLACGRRLWRSSNIRTGNPPVWSAIKPTIQPPPLTGPISNPPPPDHYQPNSPYNISTAAIAKGNSNIILVGYNNGEVWKSTDGTAATPTWDRIDDGTPLPDRWVSRIVIDSTNHSRIYISFMGYEPDNIWKSEDGGQTWANISGNLPSIPVDALALHPLQPGRLFAGTDIGLFTTTNDGATWSPVVPGVGLAEVAELVWRNDTNLMVVTHGRGIYLGAVPPTACYPNCDGSTTAPILNVADFTCFLQRFAAADPYANCDQSTTPPVLNVADFTCFLQSFAAGCP